MGLTAPAETISPFSFPTSYPTKAMPAGAPTPMPSTDDHILQRSRSLAVTNSWYANIITTIKCRQSHTCALTETDIKRPRMRADRRSLHVESSDARTCQIYLRTAVNGRPRAEKGSTRVPKNERGQGELGQGQGSHYQFLKLFAERAERHPNLALAVPGPVHDPHLVVNLCTVNTLRQSTRGALWWPGSLPQHSLAGVVQLWHSASSRGLHGQNINPFTPPTPPKLAWLPSQFPALKPSS